MAVDRERFHREFLRHRAMLEDFLHALIPDLHDADDLFQDLGVVILGKTENLPAPEDFPRWARGVARNLVRRYWRSRGRRREHPWENLANMVDTAFAEAEIDGDTTATMRRALAVCISEVGADMRELLQLHYGAGWTIEAIARQHGKRPASLRVRFSRLRQRLQRCIQRRLVGGRA